MKIGKGKKIILIVLFSFLSILHWGVAENFDFADKTVIPMDPELIKETLPNGLTYYIKENKKPEERILLRLVVDAGSILEKDNQLGLAHFLEHMAFNGTKNFPGNTLVDLLEKEGIRFGPDLNAYTSFDSTVYMLDIPAADENGNTREDLLDSALLILRDWADGITNSQDEIDKERGVVIEELRKSLGANERIGEIQRKAIFGKSRYAERDPIGTLEILENFKREELVSFYEEWYRPKLMTIIAVGDFNDEAIEKKITDTFSSLADRGSGKERTVYDVKGSLENRVSIATDSEVVSTEAKIISFIKRDNEKTVGDYRNKIVSSLYFSMLNKRYEEKRQEKDPPFIQAGAGAGHFVRKAAIFSGTTVFDPDKTESAFTAFIGELARVQQHGFTEDEFKRAKNSHLRYMEQLLKEADNTRSEALAAEYSRNYLDGEYVPGIEMEYRITEKLIKDISLENINSLSEEYIKKNEVLILLSAPQAAATSLPDEKKLIDIYEKALSAKYQPYEDNMIDEDLVNNLLPSGKANLVKEDKQNGIEYYTLSNGANLIIKKTDFRNDQVSFFAFSKGGHSVVPDEEWINANVASGVVTRGFLGNFSKIDLDKYLEGKIVNVSPYIGEIIEGFSGESSLPDLETMFQLIYLYFTSIKPDSDSFDSYMSRLRVYLENQDVSPDFAFQKALASMLTSDHLRGKIFDKTVIPEIDLDTSYKIFKERFANLGDFTFIFSGSAGADQIVPLAEKYLAFSASSESAIDADETWVDRGIRTPEGKVVKKIFMGKEELAKVALVFNGNFNWTRENTVLLAALTHAADVRLREVLREDEGGTYSISVYPEIDKYPVPEYRITVYFACAPERAEELKQLAVKELESLAETLPNDITDKFANSTIQSFDKQIKENSFWNSVIMESEFDNSDLSWIDNYKEMVKNVSPEDIKKAAALYFNPNRMVELIMLPETTE